MATRGRKPIRIPTRGKRKTRHLLDAIHRVLVLELVNERKVIAVDNVGKKSVKKCQWWLWRKENPNEF